MEFNAKAFRRIADIIEAEPGGYDQRWDLTGAGKEGCGSACCVAGHAARISNEVDGLDPGEIVLGQYQIARRVLGVKNSGSLFYATWPIWWFTESGAAGIEDLTGGTRGRTLRRDGTLRRAEPRAHEAVIVLRWIADLGRIPPAKRPAEDLTPGAARTGKPNPRHLGDEQEGRCK